MAELRHDFRHYYGCSYDAVPTREALDLIDMLPDGSKWVAKTYPLRAWSPERQRYADVLDAIYELTWGLIYNREVVPQPPRVVRPADELARREAAERKERIRRQLESDIWEEV